MGEDPDALPATYARLINAAIAGRPADMTVAIHLCRGNFRSAWVAEGGYDPVAETLFGEIDADAFFLEYDTDRAGDFAPAALCAGWQVRGAGPGQHQAPRAWRTRTR